MDTSYQHQPLFLAKGEYQGFEKIAVVTLSRDGEDWEEQISQSLHQEHPFIAEHNIQVVLTKTDPETGAGVGSIQIDDKLVIPIIIEKFKLAPLDLFWHQNKLHPLTRTSLESVLQETDIGTPVVPGQGEETDSSLYSRMQPPFDGKYTYSSAFSDLATLEGVRLGLVQGFTEEDAIRYELKKNALFSGVLRDYCRDEMEKKAATPVKDRLVVRTYAQFEKIAEHGAYEVVTNIGQRVPALVFDHVMSVNGDIQQGRGFLASMDKTASYAYLSPGQEVAGRPCAPDVDVPLSDPRQNDRGIFFKMAEDLSICTEPLSIGVRTDDGWMIRDGMNQSYRLLKIAGIREPIFDGKTLCIPEDWHWLKVASRIQPMTVKQATLTEPRKLEALSILHFDGRYTVQGLDGFSPDGDDYEKTASLLEMRFDEGDVAKTMAAAKALGAIHLCIKTAEKAELKKLASASVQGKNLFQEASFVTPMSDFFFPCSKEYHVKIAAVTDDKAKQTVDALLGLNFLNQENLYRFAEKVGIISEAKEVCAKLLLASRLGLDTDSRPLRTAMFALASVETDLRELANAIEVEEQER